jgi:nucleoside-diphosphate kinase
LDVPESLRKALKDRSEKEGVAAPDREIGRQPLSLRAKLKLSEMTNRTFTMIKPDAMKNGHAGAILDKIIKSGFRVVALKQTRLTPEKAGEFYAVHKERPFYGELVQFMSSGVIIAAILEKDNAVADFRTLIGATDPSKADEGTIRKLFATSVGENAVHGSDSDENAQIEGSFFFSGLEQF